MVSLPVGGGSGPPAVISTALRMFWVPALSTVPMSPLIINNMAAALPALLSGLTWIQVFSQQKRINTPSLIIAGLETYTGQR